MINMKIMQKQKQLWRNVEYFLKLSAQGICPEQPTIVGNKEEKKLLNKEIIFLSTSKSFRCKHQVK